MLACILACVLPIGLAGCDVLHHPLVLTVTPDGIEGDLDDPRIAWSCAIRTDDTTLCHGNADHSQVELRYAGQAPVVGAFDTVLLYRRGDRFLGLQLVYRARDGRAMVDTFGALVENRYYASRKPVERACGTNTIDDAVAQARPNVYEAAAGICADIGRIEVSWRFYRFADVNDTTTRLLELTVRGPGLEGPDSWWF